MNAQPWAQHGNMPLLLSSFGSFGVPETFTQITENDGLETLPLMCLIAETIALPMAKPPQSISADANTIVWIHLR